MTEFDVYKMLDTIRQRPAMYLREESLMNLWSFLNGYEFALTNNDVAYLKVGPFHWTFYFFVRKYYRVTNDQNTWAGIILNHCNGDDAKAFGKFFELLDEFRLQEQMN